MTDLDTYGKFLCIEEEVKRIQNRVDELGHEYDLLAVRYKAAPEPFRDELRLRMRNTFEMIDAGNTMIRMLSPALAEYQKKNPSTVRT